MKVVNGKTAAAAVVALLALVAVAPAQARRATTLKIDGAQPRAIVFVDDIRHGRADANGTRAITVLAPGRHEVVVRQPGFVDHRQIVTLSAGRTTVVRPKKATLKDAGELAFQRADDLGYSGKHEEAIPLYLEAIDARDGAYTAAQIGLTRSYLATKKTEKATEVIQAVLEAEPRNLEAVTVHANVLRDRGFYDESIARYREAIEMAPDSSPEAHTGLALVLEEQGDYAGAAENLREAIDQNDDAEPILYQLLGSVLELGGKREEAIEAYEAFLELAPQSTMATAVRSLLEQLRAAGETGEDVNPFAPPE